jgi:hypothetical protein
MRMILGLFLALTLQGSVWAQTVSNADAGSGLKEALLKGAEQAVGGLGKPNGFMGDARVRIGLPESLARGEKLARKLGMGKQLDELIETMNHAAEQAVVEAKPLLVGAVKKITFDDAKGILGGPDDAATQYFKRTTAGPISDKFLPIVHKATNKVQLADKYNQYAGKAAQLGLLDQKDANLDSYVSQKALDGLFLMIAEQEKAIRHDPVGSGSALIQKVFGSLRH